ncbi:MAG: PadR family transcriptional regulator [Oscillospiraceae bacterium]|nr:PadR family transcriptional regulator [Oscillospiraceae bacterium]
METNRTAGGIEENLKKALVEMLVLALLHQREYYAPELTQALAEYSGGAVNISFPYAILYRMIEQGYIQELSKRKAPDGRRRQYYGITLAGRQYFRENWNIYKAFTAGVDQLVETVCPIDQQEDE